MYLFKRNYNNTKIKSQHSVDRGGGTNQMDALKIIGVTLIIVIPMIIGCSFLSGKSKKFIDKLSGRENNDANNR